MSLQTGKSGLAKLATIFAIGLIISLGLCGITYISLMNSAPRGMKVPVLLMIVSAYAEVAGMAICAIGLLVVGLIALSDAVSRRFAARQNPPEDKP